MALFKREIMAVALVALGACASAPQEAAMTAAAPDAYSGKSVLDAAIEAAGGQAALSQIKELEWKGTATVNAEGKTTEIELETVVRPQSHWARSTSWTKTDGPKKARTIQAEQGKAWVVNRVTWTPMPEAQAIHENQQFSLYSVMTLVGLKGEGVTVKETAPGKDGTRNLHVEHPMAPPMDLRFNASGKLIQAGLTVKDPKGGADIVETVKFSGEIVSNGVKWPKKIAIQQNGAPYFDMEIASFEASPASKPRPLPHTLDDGQTPPQDRPADAG